MDVGLCRLWAVVAHDRAGRRDGHSDHGRRSRRFRSEPRALLFTEHAEHADGGCVTATGHAGRQSVRDTDAGRSGRNSDAGAWQYARDGAGDGW